MTFSWFCRRPWRLWLPPFELAITVTSFAFQIWPAHQWWAIFIMVVGLVMCSALFAYMIDQHYQWLIWGNDFSESDICWILNRATKAYHKFFGQF